ncbi:hypothetical protein FACS1894216_09430 [Synergistales bacterium]|nr:hypothetical protein FACS1894216_09430 [Synergistales bacterium]
MPSEKKWYYARGRQRFGPISEKHIADMINTGYILRGSLVWTKGFEKWRHAENTELLEYIEAAEALRGGADNFDFPLRFDFDGNSHDTGNGKKNIYEDDERAEQVIDANGDADSLSADEKPVQDEAAAAIVMPEPDINNADTGAEGDDAAVTDKTKSLEDEPPERLADGAERAGPAIDERVRNTAHLHEQSSMNEVNGDEAIHSLGGSDAPETYGASKRTERRNSIGCLNIFCIAVIVISAMAGAAIWFMRGSARIDSSADAWDYLDRRLNLSKGYIYDKTLSSGCLDVKAAESGLATVKTVDGGEATGYFVFAYPLWCAADNEAKMSHYAMFIISRDGSVYFRDSAALLFYNGPFLKVGRLMSPSGVKVASQSNARTLLSMTLQRQIGEYQGNGMAVFYPTDGGGLGLGYYFTHAADGSDYYVTEDGHAYALKTGNSKIVENGPFKGAVINESIYEEVVPRSAGTPQEPVPPEPVNAAARPADEGAEGSRGEPPARVSAEPQGASDGVIPGRGGEIAVITATRVNFRQLSSTSSAIIGKLTSGDKIEVINRQKTSDEYEWFLVEWKGRRGWVYGQFVKKE